MFKYHPKSRIQHCKRSKLRLNFLKVGKSLSKMPKMSILASFWKPEYCSQIVLLDRSLLIEQKLVKNAKIEKFKCDILGDFQTICSVLTHHFAINSQIYLGIRMIKRNENVGKEVKVIFFELFLFVSTDNKTSTVILKVAFSTIIQAFFNVSEGIALSISNHFKSWTKS